MLRILKSSSPIAILYLIVMAVLLHLVVFLFPVTPSVEFNDPLGKFFIFVLQQMPINQDWLHNIIAIILLIVEALYFNIILVRHKIVTRSGSIPSYCFLLSSSLFTDFLYLTPALVANLFLLIIIDKLFTIYHFEKMSSKIFDIGFILSLTTLFYFPSIAFIAFLIIGMATIRPIRLNEYIILFIGFLVPYFLTGVYYFWNDSLPILWENFRFYGIYNHKIHLTSDYSFWVITVFMFLITSWAVHIIQLSYFKTLVQIRNYFIVIFWFTVLGFLTVFCYPTIKIEYFMWLSIPSAIAFSYAIPEIRRQWVAEIAHLTLILLVLFFQYQNHFKIIK